MPTFLQKTMEIPFIDFMIFTGVYFLLGFGICAALVWINLPAIVTRQRRNR